MSKLPVVYVEDMLEAINLIERYVDAIAENEFLEDRLRQDAVIRRLVIIGEAANKLPTEARALAPDTPWRTIVGFRNVAVHEYASVHMGRVWGITQTELPKLKQQLEELRVKITAAD